MQIPVSGIVCAHRRPARVRGDVTLEDSSYSIFVAFLSLGTSDKSNLELITLTCTCVAATLFWLLLTLFIRKLKRVRMQKMQSPSHTIPLPSPGHVCMSLVQVSLGQPSCWDICVVNVTGTHSSTKNRGQLTIAEKGKLASPRDEPPN